MVLDPLVGSAGADAERGATSGCRDSGFRAVSACRGKGNRDTSMSLSRSRVATTAVFARSELPSRSAPACCALRFQVCVYPIGALPMGCLRFSSRAVDTS